MLIRDGVMSTNGNAQRVYKFENGYGASVVMGAHTYGGENGLFELAVLEFEGEGYSLTYETPITNDVLGHLTEEDVQATLKHIEALPPKEDEQ